MSKSRKVVFYYKGEEVTAEVKPLNFNKLAKATGRFTGFMKRVQTEEGPREAFNAIHAIINGGYSDIMTVMLYGPIIVEHIGKELCGLLHDLTGVEIDDIGEVDLPYLFELATAVIEVNEFDVLVKLAKNFGGQLMAKFPTLKKAVEEQK